MTVLTFGFLKHLRQSASILATPIAWLQKSSLGCLNTLCQATSCSHASQTALQDCNLRNLEGCQARHHSLTLCFPWHNPANVQHGFACASHSHQRRHMERSDIFCGPPTRPAPAAPAARPALDPRHLKGCHTAHQCPLWRNRYFFAGRAPGERQLRQRHAQLLSDGLQLVHLVQVVLRQLLLLQALRARRCPGSEPTLGRDLGF